MLDVLLATPITSFFLYVVPWCIGIVTGVLLLFNAACVFLPGACEDEEDEHIRFL